MDKRTKKKNEIIGASIDLMYLSGYNGTSVKDITKAAGIPKGSFYNYFEDKEHYAVDALHYYFSQRAEVFSETLENVDLKPLDRLRAFYECGIVWIEQNDMKLGCFLGNMMQEMGDSSELISATAAEIDNKIVAMIHQDLAEAYDNKELTTDVDLNVLARFLVSSWQGSLLRTKVYGDRTIMDDFLTVVMTQLLK
jgi:TetR/AcrR family transcriptional repressor of nem operon